MDQGLNVAVDLFVTEVAHALTESAKGTSLTEAELRRDAVSEAFAICTAIVDADERHSDNELWAIIITFAGHGLVPPNATPADLRRNRLVAEKKTWLTEPSAMFATLCDVDRKRNTDFANVYYHAAISLAHMVVSIDRFPAENELAAAADFQRRLMKNMPTAKTNTPAGADTNTDDKTDEKTTKRLEPLPKEPLERVLAELETLIGLEPVKEEVRLLTALLQVQALRHERGLPAVASNKHLVFSGNPGTGKTTVARLLARIYRSLDVVEVGHITETDRSGLVVGFVGQTAPKVAEVFDAADGGILLIDEAYSLVRGGNKDFGREAIDAIVKQVEDRRGSMVVILTGYPAEMADLIAANPGLHSRFPKTIHFDDYTDNQLVAILKLIAEANHYRLSGEANEAAAAWFGTHKRRPGFGNGRLARNLFEAAVARHATRLIKVANPTKEQLTALEAQDIASVAVQEPPPTA